MAVVYKRLLSDFYLPSPPEEAPLPHDFRRLPGEVAHRYSRALRHQLRQSRDRRTLAIDLAAELDIAVPTLPLVDLDREPERAGSSVCDLLGVTLDAQLAWREPRRSYNAWRAAIESAGVLVFQAAGIPLEEILGFSLSERPLPVIGLNRKLSPNGQAWEDLIDRHGLHGLRVTRLKEYRVLDPQEFTHSTTDELRQRPRLIGHRAAEADEIGEGRLKEGDGAGDDLPGAGVGRAGGEACAGAPASYAGGSRRRGETVSRSTKPSPRAEAIAAGLVRTGRAANYWATAGFIRADGGGPTYWISDDGTRILRGDLVDGADELQRGFLEAMALAGSEEGAKPAA
jgi:hypothetical protein